MKIKVVSLNLWHGGILFNALCAFLDQEKPDILALQEAFDSKDPALTPNFRTIDELQKRFNFAAYDFEPAFIDNRKEGKIPQGNALFSRFPIAMRGAVFFNEPFRDDYTDIPENYSTQPHVLQHATVETPAGKLTVYNVHGVWDLDGDNFSERRRKMSEAIVTAVKDKPHVILTGDTNAKPTNQAMRAVEEHLVSVFGRELPSTFNMRRKDNPGYATAAVDMMFTSADIRVASKACPDVDISDHLPLVATLEILGN